MKVDALTRAYNKAAAAKAMYARAEGLAAKDAYTLGVYVLALLEEVVRLDKRDEALRAKLEEVSDLVRKRDE